ncbi:hypothetical protein S83_050416 [Arachis hypogaea]
MSALSVSDNGQLVDADGCYCMRGEDATETSGREPLRMHRLCWEDVQSGMVLAVGAAPPWDKVYDVFEVEVSASHSGLARSAICSNGFPIIRTCRTCHSFFKCCNACWSESVIAVFTTNATVASKTYSAWSICSFVVGYIYEICPNKQAPDIRPTTFTANCSPRKQSYAQLGCFNSNSHSSYTFQPSYTQQQDNVNAMAQYQPSGQMHAPPVGQPWVSSISQSAATVTPIYHGKSGEILATALYSHCEGGGYTFSSGLRVNNMGCVNDIICSLCK